MKVMPNQNIVIYKQYIDKYALRKCPIFLHMLIIHSIFNQDNYWLYDMMEDCILIICLSLTFLELIMGDTVV